MFKFKEGYSEYFLILAVFALLLFFSGIGFKQLWKTDETRVAGISASMVRTGDYLMPKLNAEPFLEYPPMYYWTTAIFYKEFGRSMFTSRLASAICAFGAALLLFFLSKEMKFEPFYCFLSGAIISTCGQFWSVANRCIVDMMLCFFIVLAMFCFYKIHESLSDNGTIYKNSSWIVLFIISMGFGILTKSLIGLAVPSCAIFFWLISECIWKKKMFFRSWVVFIIASALSLVPVAIWLAEIYYKYGLEYARTITIDNTFGRFSGSYSQHANPAYYYLGKIPEQFLPWTVVLVVIVLLMIAYKKKLPLNTNVRFLLCWIIFPFILFAMSEGKRPIYLLPLYPAFAVLLSFLIWKSTTEIPILVKYQWKNILLALSGILLVVFIIAGIMIGVLYNKKYTYYPLFEYYQRSECVQKPLYLYSNIESMRGAINYYLNKDVPVIITENELKELVKKEKVCLLIPYFKGLESYGKIKEFKVKGDDWCILEN